MGESSCKHLPHSSQIAEHIAETDKNDKRELQAGEEPLPNDRFFDRELSWLKFNKRVLELAQDEDLPIIERASFAAIFANNLDEFFMVRVAGLKRRIDTGIAVTAASGLSPRQQLRAISEQAHRLQDEHAHYMIDHILPDLAKEQIVLLSWDKLTAAEQERLSRYYRQQVFPVLTPLAVDPAHPFPYISGGSINLAVLVENPASGKSHFARVKIPGNLNRLVPVDDMTDDDATNVRYGFITMENLIIAHLESLFPGMIIKEARSFRQLVSLQTVHASLVGEGVRTCGVLHQHGEVDGTAGNVRERVGRVHGERRQNRADEEDRKSVV